MNISKTDSRSRRRLLGVVALAATMAACSERWDQDEYSKIDDACLHRVDLAAGTTGGDETVDEPVALQVSFAGDQCYSSSCSRIDDESCALTVEGNRILVEASLVVGVKLSDAGRPGTVTCTDDCQSYTVDCEVGPLPDGVYEVYAADAAPDADPLSTFAWPPQQDELCWG